MAHKININQEAYEIPDRLTADQYQTLLNFDWQDPKYYPLIVSQLTCAPFSLISQANEDSLALAMSLIISVMNKRTECKMLDLTEVKLGQFVDMDVYLSLGLDKHFIEIRDLLCPDALWADEIMWAIEKYSEYRNYTYRQYKELFGISEKALEAAQAEEVTDKLQVARSWYRVIVNLAGENLLEIDRVTEEPVKKAFNFMAYQKERVLEAEEKQRQQRRKYDLLRNR